jgi:hypothetical protein
VAAAYRNGETIKELAGRYGIHRVTAASMLRRLGVERRRAGLSDEQVDEASRLYPEGWSLARLAGAIWRRRHDNAAIITPRGRCHAVASRALQMTYSTGRDERLLRRGVGIDHRHSGRPCCSGWES